MDDILFYLSKLFIFIINFEIFIFVTVIILFLSNILKLQKVQKLILSFLCIFILLISIIPIGHFYISKLENIYSQTPLPQKIDGILMLSGSIDPDLSDEFNQIALNELSERLLYFTFLAKKFPKAKLVYSGGSSNPLKGNKPSVFAKKYFEINGLDNTKIIYENESRNTFESLRNINKNIILNKNQKWILVTSASHMKRSMLTACKFNFNFIPYQVDYSVNRDMNFFHISYNIRSFYKFLKLYSAIYYYKITNRSC